MELEKMMKIVDILGRSPFGGININTISKDSGVSVATAYRILKSTEKKNEVLKETKGNNIFYRIKRSSNNSNYKTMSAPIDDDFTNLHKKSPNL